MFFNVFYKSEKKHVFIFFYLQTSSMLSPEQQNRGTDDDFLNKIMSALRAVGLAVFDTDDGVHCRVIYLHAMPRSVCFCSQRGDMLLGVGEYLHRIDHRNCKLTLETLIYFHQRQGSRMTLNYKNKKAVLSQR